MRQLQAKNTKDCRPPPEAWRGAGGLYPVSQRKLAPLTPWFQASSLQNCGRIHFCYFKPLRLWYFVSVAPRNEYNLYRVPSKGRVGTSRRSQNWLCDFWDLVPHMPASGRSLTLIVIHCLGVRLWGRKCRAAAHFQLAEPREPQKSTIVGPRDQLSTAENRMLLSLFVLHQHIN